MLNYNWIRDEESLQHERLRVQIVPKLILAGATSQRPDALGRLLYEHLEFQVFPPLEPGSRSRIVLVVNLEHMKRAAGDVESKKFAFREDDMLLYDPIIPILALAICDNAFLNDFDNPLDLYNLVVPPNFDRIRVYWKEEWLKRPVFRGIEGTDHNIQISLDKPFSYDSARKHLIRLGRSIGVEKELEWYDVRRGSGKKLNGICPSEQVLLAAY